MFTLNSLQYEGDYNIVNKYYKYCYTNKLEKSDKMVDVLENYKLPQVIQE